MASFDLTHLKRNQGSVLSGFHFKLQNYGKAGNYDEAENVTTVK